jgi:hypothetical protein
MFVGAPCSSGLDALYCILEYPSFTAYPGMPVQSQAAACQLASIDEVDNRHQDIGPLLADDVQRSTLPLHGGITGGCLDYQFSVPGHAASAHSMHCAASDLTTDHLHCRLQGTGLAMQLPFTCCMWQLHNRATCCAGTLQVSCLHRQALRAASHAQTGRRPCAMDAG